MVIQFSQNNVMTQYIPYEIKTGQENMQIDSDLLDFAIEKKLTESIFRLYGWNPYCVSLGRNQEDKFLDKELLSSLNIEVVRRLTGGRALLHADEITYSYILCTTRMVLFLSIKMVKNFLEFLGENIIM